MAVSIKVANASGVAIGNALITYTVSGVVATKRCDESGAAVLAGLPIGEYRFTAVADGYNAGAAIVNITIESATIPVNITLNETTAAKEEKSATIESSIEKTAASTIAAVNAVLSTTTATNMSEAKAAYKEYEKSIKTQVTEIKKAMEAEAIDSVSSQSASLIADTKVKLTESIAYYIKLRSPLVASNGTVPVKNWGAWLEYTSMIAGMYLLRGTITELMNTVLKWIISKTSGEEQ